MRDVATDRFGTLAHALENAARLSLHDPALAIEQLEEILKVHPGHAGTRAMLARVFRTIADRFTLAGETERASAAYAQSIRHSVHDPVLQQAATALCRNDLAVAERLLRERLKQVPTDVAAIRMLAEIGARLGRHRDAENLLLRAIELAPDFEAARHNLAIIQFRQQKLEEARGHIEWLLDRDPRNIQFRNLKAAILARLGEYGDAIPLYRQLARELPGDPRIWLGLGHALRSAGNNDECVAAYRRCIEARPAFGEAWWSLANLKTFRFGLADMEAMEKLLLSSQLSDDDRLHLHFALGKAREDMATYELAHLERLSRTAAPEEAARIAPEIVAQKAEIDRIRARLKDTRARAEGAETDYDRLNLLGDHYDFSDALMAIAITLLAVATLSGVHWLYWFAMLPAVGGFVFGLAAMLGRPFNMQMLFAWLG
jgi:tetratricopeptide (TPR) repeat protein